ncbi:MAG: sulfurtransferase TusA family protein [Candidatus Caenarcaniphilales bacterium]|nr:sulfurtransferase TusA family protein [Candidatus Caenarcaniphilales bacterium]
MPDFDFRGTPCPLNYIKAKLALEKLTPGTEATVWIDRGEAEESVPRSLKEEGYMILETSSEFDGCRLSVRVSKSF